ncbi:MAG: nicotinate-nucleotide adenylyltransferase [Lachnospiraceae bacterium]|nr:nicotinate-nucleotide adenylyltransferase [Lachnospiraceae bacterium]
MKKIGLLGGTFDPVHNGHLALAENALEQLSLDCVIMLVSPDPPHKQDIALSNFEKRFEMTKLAAEGLDRIIASDYETHLPVPSYTAQTLENLRDQYPHDRFFFIIGEDSLDNIEKWYEPARVMSLAELVVGIRKESFDNRPVEEQIDYLKSKYGVTIHLLDSDYVDISSTEIRERLLNGLAINDMVPEKVADFIWKEKLYTA